MHEKMMMLRVYCILVRYQKFANGSLQSCHLHVGKPIQVKRP